MYRNNNLADPNRTLAKVSDDLEKHGFSIIYTNPSYRGHRQHRYTLRNQAGAFVAWFCWYKTAATNRPYGSTPSSEQVSTHVINDHLSPTEALLLKDVLTALRHLHPVTTT